MIKDLWQSFMRLPLWVRLWVVVFLAPVNAATLAFLGEPYGLVIALLAYAGMVPNIAIMGIERGVSRLMAVPHLIFWTPMLIVVVIALSGDAVSSPVHYGFLGLLFVVDMVSLAFDARDTRDWWNGKRAIF